MSEWKEVILNEIVTKLGDGLHGTPHYDENGEYFFINGNNLVDGKIEINGNTKRINKTQFDKYKKELTDRTLLVSINGTIGNVAYYNNEKVVLGKSACYFNLKSGIEKKFVRYVLQSNLFQSYIESFATGTTIKNVSLKTMREFTFKLPSFPEQKAIAHILGTLDDKIELNRQMNQTLEAMAQALFKSWFVDFDPVIDNAIAQGNPIPEELQARAEKRRHVIAGSVIAPARRGGREERPKQSPDVIASAAKQSPSSLKPLLSTNPALAAQFPASFVFNETLGKWIPEGWEVKSVGDLSKTIFSGGTPSTSKKEYWNGSYNWFSSGETRNTFITGTEKTITKEGIKKSSTKLAFPGDILIASAGQGNTRGQTSFNCIETYINQSVVGIRAKDKTQIWLFFNLKSRYDEMRMISDSHSIRGSLTTKLLKGMYVIVPPKIDLLEYFDQLSKNSIEKIVINKLEIETLTQLRDRLLPELISGRVRVPKGMILNLENHE